jgi:hypothetical protein
LVVADDQAHLSAVKSSARVASLDREFDAAQQVDAPWSTGSSQRGEHAERDRVSPASRTRVRDRERTDRERLTP